MKKLIFCTLILFSSLYKSQSYGTDALQQIIVFIASMRVEMTAMNNKAFLSIGPKLMIEEKNYISFRGHFSKLNSPHKKLIVIPELDYIRKIATFEENSPVITSLYAGVGTTPYAVSPKVGVTFYQFFTLEVGNNFEFNEYEYFPTKGFRFSLGINLIL